MLKFILNPVSRQYAVVITANLPVMLLGLNVVWASPMLIKFRDEDQNILSRPPTEDEEAWIVSISALTGLAALLVIGNLMDLLGRKTMLVLVYIPRVTMCFVVMFATDVWMVLLGRAISGLCDMTSVSVVSTYVSEVAGKDIRGASGTVTQIMSAVGMMIMFSVGPFVSYLAVNVMMTAIVALTFIPVLLLPESPYFLYVKGRSSESVEVLTFLRGTEELAHEEIEQYAAVTGEEVINKLSLFKDRTVIKTFILVIFLSIGLQMIGYNAVNLYLQTIFEATQTSVSPEVSSLIIGVIQLVACLCTFFLTDRFGRKPIISISLIGMAIGLVGLGSFFVILENGTEIIGFLNFLPLISIMIIIYGFNAGMGSLFWILVAELFEGPIRPYGLSCGIFVTTIATFLLTRYFPALVNSIGAPALYYSFAVSCMIVCLVIGFLVPETKGKTFAEIQTALGRKDP